MPRPTLKPAALAIVKDLATDPDVQRLATLTDLERMSTQHGYGAYASRIERFARMLNAGETPSERFLIIAAETLREAGADSRGIDSAMSAMFQIEAYA